MDDFIETVADRIVEHEDRLLNVELLLCVLVNNKAIDLSVIPEKTRGLVEDTLKRIEEVWREDE